MRDMVAPSADQAIDEARETWIRGYRDAQAAGREIPVVDVPRELGDVARTSVEATQSLTRAGGRRSYVVTIDLRALEAARREREAQAHAEAVRKQRPARRQRRKGKSK